MPACLVCSHKVGVTSKGLSRRAVMYHAVVGILNDVASQIEGSVDLSASPSDGLTEFTNEDVVTKLREVAEEGRQAADAVHHAAHREGGALDFQQLHAWQEEARISMIIGHTALMSVGIRPMHDIPSFQR